PARSNTHEKAELSFPGLCLRLTAASSSRSRRVKYHADLIVRAPLRAAPVMCAVHDQFEAIWQSERSGYLQSSADISVVSHRAFEFWCFFAQRDEGAPENALAPNPASLSQCRYHRGVLEILSRQVIALPCQQGAHNTQPAAAIWPSIVRRFHWTPLSAVGRPMI